MYNQLKAYRTNEVSTASNLKLVLMMYDGVIRFLKECRTKMEENDVAGKGVYISKAQRIVGELQESLNRERGGDVAQQLEKVYSLIITKLTEANINGDVEQIDQSLAILENLRDAWKQVVNRGAEASDERGGPSSGIAINL